MYGFEVRIHRGWDDDDRHECSSQCHWSAEACGEQNASNYLETEEDAEAQLEDLADCLSGNGERVNVSDLRVVAVEVP
jgi:hypothetical protein